MTGIMRMVSIAAAFVFVAVAPGPGPAGQQTALAASAAEGVAEPASTARVAALADHTITLVNNSGQTLWIGSAVNADGSRNLTSLPTLRSGQSATVRIPESSAPGHWRGKFFARQGCGGNSGSTFRCKVGDCGPFADRCTTGEQPASLAEFNFDTRDRLAPWYNVSYVNAFSLPITIEAVNASAPAGSKECETVGCTENLLRHCPPANLRYWDSGTPMLCVNPNRDARTPYSNMISARCPKAYAWSKQDTEPGNQTMRQCRNCTGFRVTFHRG
ncbi:thaumatin family protein [Nonomuraea lactucae]|uniref:thaumatin family protein n=1 Tax=Nonomuraea lactucae TaxID=2249762 RepID=UPI000DE3819C|nr:thaumatin family protein [Nonomuraea lactucae]